jgi:hypothetical protein
VYRYDGGTSFHELDGAGNMQVEFVRGSGQGRGRKVLADRAVFGVVQWRLWLKVDHRRTRRGRRVRRRRASRRKRERVTTRRG